jgi:single-strand DNA-binding protein
MASYNKAIVVGNLTRDPELRYTPGGSAVCDFGVAVNEKYTDKQGQKVETVHFFDIVAWAKTAELVSQYCKKGSLVLVDGKLTQERWDDKNTGKKMSKVKIVAERIQFLNSRAGGGQTDGGQAPEPMVVPDQSQEDVPF